MGHDGFEDDDLPAWTAPIPPAPRRGRRSPRRWRLGRVPTVAVALLLIVTGSLQLSLDEYARSLVQERRDDANEEPAPVVNALPDGGGYGAVDPPSASGAWPPHPLNHSFDGERLTLGAPTNAGFETAATSVGSPPANISFTTAPTDQGTQLTNFGFATGDLTGWTPNPATGTSTSTLTTAAFTPEADAQAVVFDLGQLDPAGNNTLAVYALSGATYGTSTLLESFACANCTTWTSTTANITPYRALSIKLRFTRASGTVGIDNVRKQVVLAGYEATAPIARRLDGGDAFAEVKDLLTTSAFTVDATAQVATVRLRQMTPGYGDQLYLNVLSGTGYATSTRLVPQPGADDAWITFRFDVGAWLGQSIKLQVDVLFGRIGVDDVGLQRLDLAGWTVTGEAEPAAGDGGGTAARFDGTMTSAALTLPADAQQLTIRYRTPGTELYWELLTGAGYATVNPISGGLVPGSTTWTTYKAGGDVQSQVAASTNAATYALLDGQGSVRLQTDGAGAADADPYGNPRGTGTAIGALGWTGEQRDAATGLTHLRARDYDPLRGQFLSRDTVRPNGPGTQGYSAYAYTAGNPASRTDPSGHDAVGAAVWAGFLGSLYGAYQGLFSAYKALDFMPEAARGLVRGLVLLGISILRQMMVTAIVNFTVEAIAAKTGIDTLGVGKVILTLKVMQLFAANRAETRACVAASWRACVGIFQMLPLLPAVQCLAAAALFVEDYGALFSGAPATTEEGVYAGADTLGLVGDCRGFDVSELGGGGPHGGGPHGNGAGPGRGGCNSFPAGTGVLMADGSTEPIEDVGAGELVWAADPGTGEAGARAVTDAWGHVAGPLVTLHTVDAQGNVGELTATADHPVWSATDRTWDAAGELGRGEALLGADGWALSVLAVKPAAGEAMVYDLTVEGLHTFYAASGDGWVLVHNAGCSRRLRDAMASSGRPSPGSGWEAHHIVAGGDHRATEARQVLKRYGIDIDDAENGVWLPGPSLGEGGDAAPHRPVHTNAYYEDVNDALEGATSEEEVRQRLRDLRWLLGEG